MKQGIRPRAWNRKRMRRVLILPCLLMVVSGVCAGQGLAGKYLSISTTVNTLGAHWHENGVHLEVTDRGGNSRAIFAFTDNGDVLGAKETLIPIVKGRRVDFEFEGCLTGNLDDADGKPCKPMTGKPRQDGETVLGRLQCEAAEDWQTLRCSYAWPFGDVNYFTLKRVQDYWETGKTWPRKLELDIDRAGNPRSVEAAIYRMPPMPPAVLKQVRLQEKSFAGTFKEPIPQDGIMQLGVIENRRRGVKTEAREGVEEEELVQHFLVISAYLASEQIFFSYSRSEILELALTAYRIGTPAIMEAVGMARNAGIRAPKLKDIVAGGNGSPLARALPFQYADSPGFARVAGYAPAILSAAKFPPSRAAK